MMKCTNCPWEGDKDKLSKGRFCPVCGDNVSETVTHMIPSIVNELDLNRDGKVDQADVKLAATLMGKQKKKR